MAVDVKTRVTPKWLALDGTKDSNLRSISWLNSPLSRQVPGGGGAYRAAPGSLWWEASPERVSPPVAFYTGFLVEPIIVATGRTAVCLGYFLKAFFLWQY